MLTKNFPGRVKLRRQTALTRLKEKLAMPIKELTKVSKRFYNTTPNVDATKDIEEYRKELMRQVGVLEERIKMVQ